MLRNMLALAAGAVLLAAAAGDDDKKKGAAALEGNWTATSWRRGEGEVGAEKVNTELVLGKDTYEFPKGINRISEAGTYKADPAAGTIDFTPGDGPAKGKTLLGRYKVEKNVLTLCFAAAGRDRPKGLESTDRKTVLATYEKK